MCVCVCMCVWVCVCVCVCVCGCVCGCVCVCVHISTSYYKPTVYFCLLMQSFPRFNFISDSVLLGILSATNAVESIRPYLPSLFGSISEVGITHLYDIDHGSWPVVSSVSSFEGETLELAETVVLGGDLESWLSAVIGEVKTTLQGKMSTAIAEIYEALSEKENKFEGFVRKVNT